MRYLGNRLRDLLFPRRCAVCDRALLKEEKGVCGACGKKIRYVGKNVCSLCGRPVKGLEEYCRECTENRHHFLGGRFPLSYDFIGDSVFRFKYDNRPEYAGFYADQIVKQWGEWINALEADALIPVPLHQKRLAKRGYNQAEVLAAELSKRTKIPLEAGLAARVRNTAPQKKFDRKDRQINVKGAFIVRESSVKLNTVIVVDDIFTTGSTIDSLSEQLLKAGVSRVYFLTVTAAGT